MSSYGSGEDDPTYGTPPGAYPAGQPGQVPITPGYGPPPAHGQPPIPQQPMYGQQHPAYVVHYAPPPAPKKRRIGRIILTVVAAVVVLCVGIGVLAVALGGGGSSSGSFGLNQAARDGKFEFVVQSVKCGIPQEGSSSFGEKPQGQFCEAHMTVKNIGNEAQLFDDSDQKAFNAAGQEYSADTAAGLDANSGTAAFLNQINPGNTVTGIVVFDIPKGQSITKLELHDSPFSGGVTVNVG